MLLALSSLLQLCDALEEPVASRMRISKQVSESAIASLTGIAVSEEEKPMKVDPTEDETIAWTRPVYDFKLTPVWQPCLVRNTFHPKSIEGVDR